MSGVRRRRLAAACVAGGAVHQRAATGDAQTGDALLDEQIRFAEQRAVRAELLDHVAQVAEVVNETPHRALALAFSLEDAEELQYEILHFGAFDLQGRLEGARQRDR